MKTLEQIKNDYAKTKNVATWDLLVYKMKFDDILYSDFLNYENEVMKIYAMECLKLASENAYLNGNEYSRCGCEVNTESITNEKNIIK